MSEIEKKSHYLNKISIKNVQDTSLFIIGCYSLYGYLSYNLLPLLYDNIQEEDLIRPYEVLYPFLGLYAVMDFFIADSYEFKIHHTCIIWILLYDYYNSVPSSHRCLLSYRVLNTEVWSIFWVLKYWLPPNTMISNLNNILFMILFAKLRVYDFYYQVIYNNISLETILINYSNDGDYLCKITFYIFFLSCYILFILNLYWFMIINKSFYKTINKIININTHSICHYLCSYIHIINIPISLFIYSYNPHEKNLLDIFGISCLSYSSYMYHKNIYNRLYNKKIDYYEIPDKENIIEFLTDSTWISVRSFLVIVTNYYDHEKFCNIIALSGGFHLLTLYYSIINSFELIIDRDTKRNNFLALHNIFVSSPILFDVILVCLNSKKEISIPYFFVNVTIGILYYIQPYYNLTHVGFHILLIIQNYYMNLSNISQI